jgi:predicted DNA-binding transcriptional regulator AlpA
MSDSLLTEKELSAQLHVSLASVRRWRLLGCGPRFVKLGSLVRYRHEDVQNWINTRPTGGELAKDTH